eukprot:6188109-Pleurochrysis_carterae.AAC.1
MSSAPIWTHNFLIWIDADCCARAGSPRARHVASRSSVGRRAAHAAVAAAASALDRRVRTCARAPACGGNRLKRCKCVEHASRSGARWRSAHADGGDAALAHGGRELRRDRHLRRGDGATTAAAPPGSSAQVRTDGGTRTCNRSLRQK